MTTFITHTVHEVISTLTDGKQIAEDFKEANSRHNYRAKAKLLGHPLVEPYNAVYLDGVPGGLSGYWTVLSVKHIFGGEIPYVMEVEVGSDGFPEQRTELTQESTRDLESELLADEFAVSTTDAESEIPMYDAEMLFKIAESEQEPGAVKPTSTTTATGDPAPDFSIINKSSGWVAV